MQMPSIETIDLTKRFGRFTAVNGLNLRIEGSKCVGFLGPNGAGKTTTLKMLTAMMTPSEGECRINGMSVHSDRRNALSVTGAVIETPEIYPALTPREALRMVADIRGVPCLKRKERIEDILSVVGMQEWADKKIGRFSKGMKQRVNIATALIHDPQVVILDEPTSGLDPRGMAEIRELIRGLKGSDHLILMSTHLLSEVKDTCDTIALINHGTLLLYDTMANAEDRFSDEVSMIRVELWRPTDCSAKLPSIESYPGVISCVQTGPRHLKIEFAGRPEKLRNLHHFLLEKHIDVASFSRGENALEQMYLKQIEKGD